MNPTDDDVQNQPPHGVDPSYAGWQLARALLASEQHADPAVRERALDKIRRWTAVLRGMFDGTLAPGSRTPVAGVPAWATLEVVTGGFATGALRAGGPLRPHEQRAADQLRVPADLEPRAALNGYYLTDDGLVELGAQLRSAAYDIEVPEEAALLSIAWLVERGHTDAARELIDVIAPWFGSLRFYPVPRERPRRFDGVYIDDVGTIAGVLADAVPHQQILAQREAVEVWAPLQDRMIELIAETVEDGWPCRHYPAGWTRRAQSLLDEYAQLRRVYTRCGKPDKARGHFAQLRAFIAHCIDDPAGLSGRDVGRIKRIYDSNVERNGAPGSNARAARRMHQRDHVAAPLHADVARIVRARLQAFPPDAGIDERDATTRDIEPAEANAAVPAGTAIPPSLQRKVRRCIAAPVAELVRQRLITSGDALARVLPQITADFRSAGFDDPALRNLYAATCRAFARRRSLLLLNLESQVKLRELPWIAAIERFRERDATGRDDAFRALERVTLLALTSFPHAMLPNKLVQELGALAAAANVKLVLLKELAADIFMGTFSDPFVRSAKCAAHLLNGTLYAAYYGIDYAEVLALPDPDPVDGTSQRLRTSAGACRFAALCARRAGGAASRRGPAGNGMVIEQQQIVTTQNLAALYVALDRPEPLRAQFEPMARHCLRWICRRLQISPAHWHARSIDVKNAAYAWRQMVFFLSLASDAERHAFFAWAMPHLQMQAPAFAQQFGPALNRLHAIAGGSAPNDAMPGNDSRCFVGWSMERHWLSGPDAR